MLRNRGKEIREDITKNLDIYEEHLPGVEKEVFKQLLYLMEG